MINEKLKMWWETARPKTLPLALASIFTGSALGYWANPQGFNGLVMVLCLLTTILLQVLSNFANDYGDHQKVQILKNVLGHYVAFKRRNFSKRTEMGINSNSDGKFSFRKFLDWNRL